MNQDKPNTTHQPAPTEEDALSEEVREAQQAYLLLQLLDADGQSMTRGDANKFRGAPAKRLSLKPAVANHRRAQLAEQGYIRISRKARSEHLQLTADGLDYLVAGARHLGHGEFKVKGRTLNALVAASRESSFEHSSNAGLHAPSSEELAKAVLAEFDDLRRERHGRSGLVPIHEVRDRIVARYGNTAGRHDVLDKVILGLWQEKRIGLEAINDLAEVSERQLNDSIQGVSGTLFYLEAPREQPVAP